MRTTRRSLLAGSLSAALLRGADNQSKQFLKFDTQAKQLLGRMTLEEKIGQMLQPDQAFLHSVDDIEKYAFGSLLSGGDSEPKAGATLTAWTEMYDTYQQHALKSRLRIPLVYGIDSVHGADKILGGVVFPHNIGLGCTRYADLVEKAARITGEEMRATGINWVFGPCVAVPQDIRWGRTYEGYSESPDLVKELGAAAVRGLQRGSLDDPSAVLASVKHYAGDGGTVFGTGKPMREGSSQRFPLDQGDVQMDEATFRKLFLPGYVTTIAASAATVMPSYSSWNGVKCTGNKRLLTDILKGELGFDGFVISDYDAIFQLPGSFNDQVRDAINAGIDMEMLSRKYVEVFEALVALAKQGAVPVVRIDDAVTRILRVKFALGLLDAKRSPMAGRSLQRSFGSADHRAVARDCVRQSLVLLKNDRNILPLKKTARVHVAGKSADNLGYQCGGWTMTWQGKGGAIDTGTTILAALRKAAGSSGEVTHSLDGSGAAGASVGIAVIGETPYAEFMGDRTDLRVAREDVAVVERLKSAGIPVVVLLVSGRPMIIDEILPKADAIVAAWLPGSEGEGVSDLLYGDAKPTGKLSFTWPRGDSTSLHLGAAGYHTLFPFGYGLS